jgi:hypothetical protein
MQSGRQEDGIVVSKSAKLFQNVLTELETGFRFSSQGHK